MLGFETCWAPECESQNLRHSYASNLFAHGATIAEVQHRMGHSSPAVTVRVYTHFIPNSDSGTSTRFTASFLEKMPHDGKDQATA
jgi:Phage integrase family